jgi:hypothetical protein
MPSSASNSHGARGSIRPATLSSRVHYDTDALPLSQTPLYSKPSKIKAFESEVGAKMGAKFGCSHHLRKQKAPL